MHWPAICSKPDRSRPHTSSDIIAGVRYTKFCTFMYRHVSLDEASGRSLGMVCIWGPFGKQIALLSRVGIL